MTHRPQIAVIGGGIGGLALALALRRRDIDVTVYEQSPSLSEIGAGLNLTPNAMKALRALGIEHEALAIAFESEFAVLRSWKNGRIISRQPRRHAFSARFGGAYCSVHRADLLDILARALPASAIKLDTKCIAVEPGERSAVARFADGSAIEADLVVGADGIHSVVRTSLFGPEAPRFTGCVCWRGLVPADSLPRDWNFNDSTAWMGPYGHVVHYFVRRGALLNIVAHYDSDAWTEESWTRRAERQELMETYRGWNEALLRLFAAGDQYYKWALYDREPLARWSKGRATLMGDSAHAMLPYLAQGACMAIEDGYVLAAAIANAAEDLSAALAQYEALRIPRTRRTVLGSRFRAKENHLASPWKRLLRDVKIGLRDRFSSDQTAFRAAWLYDYDVAQEQRLPARAAAAE